MSITWNEWRGSMDGRPTLWIKRLVKLFGCRVDLHKMIGADDEECFHTHPAYAIRIILRGGYIEELAGGDIKFWYPGMIGLVKPTFCHRIDVASQAGALMGQFIESSSRAANIQILKPILVVFAKTPLLRRSTAF